MAGGSNGRSNIASTFRGRCSGKLATGDGHSTVAELATTRSPNKKQKTAAAATAAFAVAAAEAGGTGTFETATVVRVVFRGMYRTTKPCRWLLLVDSASDSGQVPHTGKTLKSESHAKARKSLENDY